MTETAFEKLLDESLTTLNFEQGALISGVIVDLTSDWVTVHVGLKSESLIPRTEFLADEAEGELSVGCLLYTSPSPRDRQKSRMPSSA